MKSRFEQKLTLQALRFKFDDSSKLIDLALEGPESEELKTKLKIKNVCAALSGELVERLENTLGILNMSKREFFEMAIIEALDKADSIMDDVGIDDYLEELASKHGQETV